MVWRFDYVYVVALIFFNLVFLLYYMVKDESINEAEARASRQVKTKSHYGAVRGIHRKSLVLKK